MSGSKTSHVAGAADAIMGMKLKGDTDGSDFEEENVSKKRRGVEKSESKNNLEVRIKDLENKMQKMNFTVGTGEFTMNVTTALMQEVVDLNYRVGQLEHAMYDSWELQAGSPFLEEVANWKDNWITKCGEMRGK